MVAVAPGHSVCAQLLLKGKMRCPQNMGTQGNLGWVLLHTAAGRCLSTAGKHLSPFFPAMENSSVFCLAGASQQHSPVQSIL